jgi:hypothetical protein
MASHCNRQKGLRCGITPENGKKQDRKKPHAQVQGIGAVRKGWSMSLKSAEV